MNRVDSRAVAAMAGVSQSTVSKALNGRPDSRISEQTRQKVLKAAQELNYAPNVIARALVTGKTQRIGVVVNTPASLTNLAGYHLGILSGTLYGAVANNYNLLLHSSQYPHWYALYDDIRGGSADGVLIVGDYHDKELEEALVADEFPTVFVSHHPKGERVFSVDCDNVQGGYIAAKHLIDLGRRRMVFLSESMMSWEEERRQGVENAVREAQIAGSEIVFSAHIVANGAEACHEILAQLPECGVVTATEALGLELAEALTTQGRQIPQEVSIVSFNSTEASANAPIPMTSVYQPLCEIGFTALNLLVSLLKGQNIAPGVRRVSVRLDVRESCGAKK